MAEMVRMAHPTFNDTFYEVPVDVQQDWLDQGYLLAPEGELADEGTAAEQPPAQETPPSAADGPQGVVTPNDGPVNTDTTQP